MALLEQRSGVIGKGLSLLEKVRNGHLAVASRSHLFELMEKLRPKQLQISTVTTDGDIVEIYPFLDAPPYQFKNGDSIDQPEVIVVQQPIPGKIPNRPFIQIVIIGDQQTTGVLHYEASILNQSEISESRFAYLADEPGQEGKNQPRIFHEQMRRIWKGTIHEPTQEEYMFGGGIFSAPTREIRPGIPNPQEWITDRNYFNQAITRSYHLLAHTLLNVGEVKPLEEPLKGPGLLDSL